MAAFVRVNVPALTIVGGVITAISFAGNEGSAYVYPELEFDDPAGSAGGSGASAFQGGLGGAFAARAPATTPIDLQKVDFDQFEHLLGAVQGAYGEENLDRLRTLATPEMVAYLAQDLAENTSRGVTNRLSQVKLLQGDLSEAWREGMSDYATVAMRFSLIDVMLERGSNRVVSGDPSQATEAREVWTFVRPAGTPAAGWMLSAIQQA
jgi:predicted lipid-binding transport protein (Tim44 family)